MKRRIKVLFIIFFLCCVAGWIYEMGFYRLDKGMFIKRGQGFGPWLPIYGFGSLAIVEYSNRFADTKVQVFFGSCLVTGLIELITGWMLFRFAGGLRLWDYNVEIWNWGNIGGYVCVRSVVVFGFAGLILVYWLVPAVQKITNSMSEKQLTWFTVPLMGIMFCDIFWGYIIKPIMFLVK